MKNTTLYIIYLCILLFSLMCGLIRYKRLDSPSKVLIVLLAFTFLSECIAWGFTSYFGNNMPVYHVYAPLHFFTVAVYFNNSIDEFKKKNIGWYVGFAGLGLSIMNTLFLQPFTALNSYFLMFSGFAIIAMSLYAFYKILENDAVGVLNNPHFWFSAILLFFWSTTYINWLLYKILGQKMLQLMPFIGKALLFISAITYLSFGLVYLFYPKGKSLG